MKDFAQERSRLVEKHVAARGVKDPRVLAAFSKVPREFFVPEHLRPHAYEDRPLPIADGQVIAQPYVAAFMVEALGLQGGERVLEIGAGAGYTAAVLAEIAAEVYAIEPVAQIAEKAASHLMDAGYENVHVIHDDGMRGWIEEAPFDAILISAAVPDIPETLKNQLVTGGRMVVVVGPDDHAQELVRITRGEKGQFTTEDLADIRFVPLLDETLWNVEKTVAAPAPRFVEARPRGVEDLPRLIGRHAEPFDDIETADLAPLLERIGEKRIVLIGEASHGTSEFYRMRARITRRLIREKGFNIVAAEADWPDAARIDHYVRHSDVPPDEWEAFGRFPTWMWRNEETRDFADWLHAFNAERPPEARAGFYGLDLYSLYNSTRAILAYLDDVDPALAAIARQRYGCLSPWEADPAAYGRATVSGAYRGCELEVTRMLAELMKKRRDLMVHDGDRFFDAAQNAALIANAERYYRIMYYGSRASWNLRDTHMFETLRNLLEWRGDGAKAVVWAHNSHIGDARATEMSHRGEHNLGEMCERGYGSESYRIGFGTDRGTVAAASAWDSPMEIKRVRPSHQQSYERQFHLTGLSGLILPMRAGQELDLATALSVPRLERAIGVIYRPESELASHYFEAELPRQFNEYIWIDETSAVTPLSVSQADGLPDTYPFGL